MKRFLTLLALILLAVPAFPAAVSAGDVADFRIEGGATETTVPFRFINDHIYVEAHVNEVAGLYILDTGGQNSLMPDTAERLDLAMTGSRPVIGIGGHNAVSGTARVDSIRIGHAVISNQPVSVFSFQNANVDGVDCAGMIGYEFFSRFVTRFDYGKHTIIFVDRDAFDPANAGTAVPMRVDNHYPEVSGTYAGIPARFLIDTGSRMPLTLSGRFAADHRLPRDGVEAVTGWGIGGPFRSTVQRGKALMLGPARIDAPLTMIEVGNSGAAMIDGVLNDIGGGILKRFAVTFDYQHATMYLKPVEGPIADLDTFDRSGMWINAEDREFKVIDVTKGGPAESAGLKPGDIIAAVDGVPAGRIGLHDLRYRLRNDPPGTKVVFAVKRGNGAEDVPLTLRDQF